MLKQLYAPWRENYLNGKKNSSCVFCHISKNTHLDDEGRVLYRDDKCFIVMNLYPYTPGHFMIIPHTHLNSLENLDSEVWIHMNILAQKGVKLLKDTLDAGGVNLGMNIGADAGAGIAEHLHLHLVPRWNKDTNFITTIANTRVYGNDELELFKKLKVKANEYFKL